MTTPETLPMRPELPAACRSIACCCPPTRVRAFEIRRKNLNRRAREAAILLTGVQGVPQQNGCVGSNCINVQETYAYNNRLQNVMIELGKSGSPTADSCRVYNYYADKANPTTCATMPAQGTQDNGNVAGYYYNDNMNSGLNHAAAYSYDGVNRLTAAGTTGNWVFNQTYTYTNDGSNGQYGNMSCSPAGPACGARSLSEITIRQRRINDLQTPTSR